MAEITEERRAFLREIGAKGGRTTAARYDMRERGRRGFLGLARRLGDNGQAVGYLQKHAGMPKLPRSQWTKNKQWQED